MAQNGIFVNPQPFSKVQAITKSDVTVYNPPLDGFIPGTSANVAIKDLAGDTVTIAVIAGQLYPIGASMIMSTNTTATGIVGVNW